MKKQLLAIAIAALSVTGVYAQSSSTAVTINLTGHQAAMMQLGSNMGMYGAGVAAFFPVAAAKGCSVPNPQTGLARANANLATVTASSTVTDKEAGALYTVILGVYETLLQAKQTKSSVTIYANKDNTSNDCTLTGAQLN